MKKFYLCLLLLAGFGVEARAALARPFLGDARPPRVVKVGKELAAVAAGQAEIVVAADASRMTRYAADELAAYLSKRLGGAVPVVNAPTAEKVSFFVGISPFSRAAGIDDANLCRDAFIIKTAGGDVYLLGKDDPTADEKRDIAAGGIWGRFHEKGSLFAVYDFLERVGGVRFYFPGELGVYVPEGGALSLPELDIFDRPDFESRYLSIYYGREDGDGDAVKPFTASVSPGKNRYYNRLRLQTEYVPNSHGLAALGLAARFGETHPEYFALRDDGRRYSDPNMAFCPQICYSGGIMEELYRDAEALLTGKPAAARGITTPHGAVWDPSCHREPKDGLPGIFGMMPADSFYPCRCPDCQAHFAKGDQAASDFIWGKTAELARRLRDNGIDGYVSMMAYPPYHQVPNVALPDNILVMVAASGPWRSPALSRDADERVDNWRKKTGDKPWLWTYANKFATLQMPDIPSSTPRAVGRFYGGFKNRAYGAFMESETDRLIYHYLNYYVFAKVAWDNDCDVDRLLAEHHALMFGKAAGAMGRVFDRFEERWVGRIAGRVVETNLGPIAVVPAENEIWSNIYSAGELKNLAALFDEAAKRAAGDAVATRRIAHIRAQFLAPLQEAGLAYRAKNDSIAHFKAAIGTTLFLQPFGEVEAPVAASVTPTDAGDSLVFAFACEEPEFDRAVAVARQADDTGIWEDNNVELFLNPSGDRQNYYQLMVNSAGSAVGRRWSPGENEAWDSGATVDITTDDAGWRAVVTLPKRSMDAFAPEGFVANFTRTRAIRERKAERYTWSPFLKDGFHEIGNFGILVPRPAPEDSLLRHGDFEGIAKNAQFFGPWFRRSDEVPGASAELDRSTFVFGRQSMKIQVTNPDDPQLFGVTQNLPGLKPNTRYELSFYVRSEDVVPLKAGGGVCAVVMDSRNNWFPDNRMVGTTPWIRQHFTFTTTETTNQPRSYMTLYSIYATGTIWFDGVILREAR